jgi:hypothetical protein
MNIMERKNTELIKEFNRYIREHPEFANNIPNNAIVVMQLEEDNAFNTWSDVVAKSHVEEGQPIVYIRIKRLKPIHSRIEDLEIVV